LILLRRPRYVVLRALNHLINIRQVNVFKLGHCFKALHEKITLSRNGILPVLPEDLIYRFASKLEFGSKTVDVAQHAVRLVGRMTQDWIVAGRRPAGICAAALVMSARLHNFRRTTQDVEHLVKVTWGTIQKRLDEFKRTASANLTVDDFIRNQFLESSHDPPSFYEKTAAFQAEKRKRKRKRPLELDNDEDDTGSQERNEPDEEQERLISITASLTPELSTLPRVEYLRDAEGFIIPPPPARKEIPIDPALLAEDDPRALETLVLEHGDNDSESEEPDDSDGDSQTSSQRRRVKNKGKGRALVDWDGEDISIDGEVSQSFGDPNTVEHAKAFAAASHRARVHIMYADALKPVKDVPMTEIIDESEFAGDIEVENCLLPEGEAAIKERIWLNENKDWVLKQQEKEFKRQLEAMGPPKAKRKRVKKPRIGEGQTSAASTPAEAAVERLKERAWSKRINYDAIASMFDGPRRTLGSAATSRVTSIAGSTVVSSDAASSVNESFAETNSVAQPSDVEPSDVGNMDDFEGEDLDDNWRKEFEQSEDEE
jgi:transcription factor IIIB 90 kDa subunit